MFFLLFEFKDLIKERQLKEEQSKNYISDKCTPDEFGYGETAIGTSGLYLYNTRKLLDNAGYISEDVAEQHGGATNWEVSVVVDSCQNTEYLIFKDTETGNICAVERRKYEQEIPESERCYLNKED